MRRLIIISNRAPVNIIRNESGYDFIESSGGLASGLRAFMAKKQFENVKEKNIIWLGWPGASVPEQDKKKLKRELIEKAGTSPVFIADNIMQKFYAGFCNKTLWPLFHYFPLYAEYEQEQWEQYIQVNKIFCDELLNVYHPGDLIWIHDYHLMLLPAMIREKLPNATIGFFLHIPFPSYEVFRLLPRQWRKKILEGLYGSDLIGFHTHDYRTYFLRSTLRILGITSRMGELTYNNRHVKVDSFPMGIDYDKYHAAVELPAVKAELEKFRGNFENKKIILSIDRQDYSKGILHRLHAYEHFLKTNEQYITKVMMVMIVIPSRIGVENYSAIKDQIDQFAGKINGAYGTLEWMPILYQYRSLSFEELIALYSISDIALVTPLRDGMNLIAKEYIAAKTNANGVLILSEMAGAADELIEAIIINPNNKEEISRAIAAALKMEASVRDEKIKSMQKRLKDTDLFKWADNFITAMADAHAKQITSQARELSGNSRANLIKNFQQHTRRILFLDYDGTLQPYASTPAEAVPSQKLMSTLENLFSLDNTELVLISGRDWQTLDKWFGTLPVSIVAEHGLFLKEKNRSWHMLRPVRKNWKKGVQAIMNNFAEKLPGCLVEEKDYSLAFHYRRSDAGLANVRVRELVNYLTSYTANMDLKLMRGNKVVEVRPAGIDKGIAAMHWLSGVMANESFILAIGDDATDEDLFRVMPQRAFSIKVGVGSSGALYNLNNTDEVLHLLNDMIADAE
jgi:trehalose 6-phosphate synthase/phosphatase